MWITLPKMFHLLILRKLYQEYRHIKTTFQKLFSQLTYTCKKSTIEAREKGVKYIQIKQ